MDAEKFLAACIGLVQGAGFDPFDLDQAPDFLKEKWKEEGQTDPFDLDQAPDFLKEKWKEEGQTEPFGHVDLGTVEDGND